MNLNWELCLRNIRKETETWKLLQNSFESRGKNRKRNLSTWLKVGPSGYILTSSQQSVRQLLEISCFLKMCSVSFSAIFITSLYSVLLNSVTWHALLLSRWRIRNPCTGLQRPWLFQQVQAPRFRDSRHIKVVRFSALRTGRLYSPGSIPDTHCCYRQRRSQGHSAAGRIVSMKNSNDTFIQIVYKNSVGSFRKT